MRKITAAALAALTAIAFCAGTVPLPAAGEGADGAATRPSPMPENTVYVIPGGQLTGDETSFTIWGRDYKGQNGTQIFTSVRAGLDALKPGGELWLAPGIYSENVVIDRDVTVLGPKANIGPNLRGMAPGDVTRDPERGEGEAVITANWHMGVNATSNEVFDCHEITVNGVAVSKGGMFRSNYGRDGEIRLFYSCILVYGYTTPNNGPFYCYSYYPDRSTNRYKRTLWFEHIRFEDLTTAPGFTLNADSVGMKDVCFDAGCTARAFSYLTVNDISVQSEQIVRYSIEDCVFMQKCRQPLMLDLSTSAGGYGFNRTIGSKKKVEVMVSGCVFVGNNSEMTEESLILTKADTANVEFTVENNTYIASTDQPVAADERTYDLNTEVRYYGRTYIDGPVAWFNWSGSGFSVSFTGSGLSAMIHSNAPGGDNTAYLNVYVDGVETGQLQLIGQKQEFSLASGLDPSVEHTVKVIKRTNARSSTAGVSVIRLDDGKKLAPEPEAGRLIEFVGDSLTVGYAAAAMPGVTEAWSTKTEDVTRTYIPAVAEAFGADYSVIAISGRGVVSNYGGEPNRLLPDLYPLTDDYNWPGAKWNFERKADVIVINAGTNDATASVGTVEMKAGCVAFIKEIRELNPDAEIIWTYGLTTTSLMKPIKDAVEEIRAGGDTKVSFFQFDICRGADLALGHPTSWGYSARAESLIAAIAAATGWKATGGNAADETTAVAGETGTEAEPVTGEAPVEKGCSSAAAALPALSGALAAAAFSGKKKMTPKRKRSKED